jgi:transposase
MFLAWQSDAASSHTSREAAAKERRRILAFEARPCACCWSKSSAWLPWRGALHGTKIWIAAGVTDMRRGFDGLSAKVQTVLEQQPFSGHVFVFRGRRGDIVKLLWWDGDGLCLFAKRLERGRFIWPQATEGTVCLTRAQLSMLLEGIDWRRPERTWTPHLAV